MSRLLKKKLISCIVTKGNTFSNEILFKSCLKYLTRKKNKKIRNLIFLVVNNALPTFKLETKRLKTKKIKLIKFKPFFIQKNKNRIFFSIKFIINSARKKSNNFFKNLNSEFIATNRQDSDSLLVKNKNQEHALLYQNALLFYRWN
jgi:ribosomal protein S7